MRPDAQRTNQRVQAPTPRPLALLHGHDEPGREGRGQDHHAVATGLGAMQHGDRPDGDERRGDQRAARAKGPARQRVDGGDRRQGGEQGRRSKRNLETGPGLQKPNRGPRRQRVGDVVGRLEEVADDRARPVGAEREPRRDLVVPEALAEPRRAKTKRDQDQAEHVPELA